MLVVEIAGDGNMYAVRGRAGHVVHTGLSLEDAQRDVERQRIARTAAIAIGCDHGDFSEGEKGLAEAADALRPEAVVVAD